MNKKVNGRRPHATQQAQVFQLDTERSYGCYGGIKHTSNHHSTHSWPTKWHVVF